MTWPKGPIRGGVLGENERSGLPPHQLGGLGESCKLPPTRLARGLRPLSRPLGGLSPTNIKRRLIAMIEEISLSINHFNESIIYLF